MAIDWDAELLDPVMAAFGEGQATDPSSWPTYYPKGDSAFQLEGAVFDQEYHRVSELGDGTVSSSSHPVLGVRSGLFVAAPAQGDRVYIPSADQAFAVVDVEPDGHGHILLILMKAG